MIAPGLGPGERRTAEGTASEPVRSQFDRAASDLITAVGATPGCNADLPGLSRQRVLEPLATSDAEFGASFDRAAQTATRVWIRRAAHTTSTRRSRTRRPIR